MSRYAPYLSGIPMPESVRRLPICPVRKVPIPWFVSTLADGTREFRLADGEKFRQAVTQYRCWVCGDTLGVDLAFVLGPMCTVNRISAEPPCHPECAEFSARACPFLIKPHMVRRENDLPDAKTSCAGHMIARNPGVVCVWITGYRSLEASVGKGMLFRVGEPHRWTWWAEGRTATRAEILASIDSGLPALSAMCEDASEVAQLEAARVKSLNYLPAA